MHIHSVSTDCLKMAVPSLSLLHPPRSACKKGDVMSITQSSRKNRPIFWQHAENPVIPVHRAEALKAAALEDKPIFLSYRLFHCHWKPRNGPRVL